MVISTSIGDDGEDEAAIAAELFNHTRKTRVFSGRSPSRNTEFVERTMRTHADRAEQFSKDAFEANRNAIFPCRKKFDSSVTALILSPWPFLDYLLDMEIDTPFLDYPLNMEIDTPFFDYPLKMRLHRPFGHQRTEWEHKPYACADPGW
jgi:hypothetical protein